MHNRTFSVYYTRFLLKWVNFTLFLVASFLCGTATKEVLNFLLATRMIYPGTVHECYMTEMYQRRIYFPDATYIADFIQNECGKGV